MDEAIYTFMLGLAKFVATGIPLVVVTLSSAALIFAPAPHEPGRKSINCLRLTGLFCALIWLFYYAEIWSPTRIPLFDYGAPLVALFGLIILPVLAVTLWWQRREFKHSARLKGLFALANGLALFSLAPGLFIVLFFAAALSSSR